MHRHDVDWLRALTLGLLICGYIPAVCTLHLFYPESEICRRNLAVYGLNQYLANSVALYYFRNGCLFCHAQEKLERIAERPDKKNTTTPDFWFIIYCSRSRVYLPIIYGPRSYLFPKSRASLVPEQYFYLCSGSVPRFLLSKEKPS